MKRYFLVLFSLLTISTYADTNWSQTVHVKDITIYGTECLVSFSEDISFAPRIYGRWQIKLPNVSDAQNKAMLALLIEAKTNGSALQIVANNAAVNPTTAAQLPLFFAISNFIP